MTDTTFDIHMNPDLNSGNRYVHTLYKILLYLLCGGYVSTYHILA